MTLSLGLSVCLALSVAAQTVDTAAPAPNEAKDEATSAPAADAPILPPSLVEQPPLVHPLPDEEARALGKATITVMVDVDDEGAVKSVAVVDDGSHPNPALRRAALAVAAATVFSPATKGGVPTSVRLPVELTFTPPPPKPEPVPVQEAEPAPTTEANEPSAGQQPSTEAEEAAPAADELPAFADDAVAARSWSDTGQALVVGGALVASTAFLVSTFSAVTALDNASRMEENGAPADEVDAQRTFGIMMLIPVGGPFIAAATAPDATTALLSAGAGVAQVVGTGVALTGAGLWTWDALADDDDEKAAE